MDINTQAATKGLRCAASKGLGVVTMEPLLGGRLVNPPAPVPAVWDRAGVVRTPEEWAMRWLWDQPVLLDRYPVTDLLQVGYQPGASKTPKGMAKPSVQL